MGRWRRYFKLKVSDRKSPCSGHFAVFLLTDLEIIKDRVVPYKLYQYMTNALGDRALTIQVLNAEFIFMLKLLKLLLRRLFVMFLILLGRLDSAVNLLANE